MGFLLKFEALKAYFKYLLYRLGWNDWFYSLFYRLSRLENRAANRAFLREYPDIIVPPDHFLHETYRVDYRKFIMDGRMAAQEIRDWSRVYLPGPVHHILDWGCGAGRIIRHLPELFPAAEIHGCDTNPGMIAWNISHYGDIRFMLTDHVPPTAYPASRFDLVYGFSVLTHIDANLQESWLIELRRILRKDGILMITSHGNRYTGQLVAPEKKSLQRDGIYTRSFHKKGHRMATTYHDPSAFRQLLEKYFTVLEYHDGELDPRKTGGQDLWIVRKS